MESDLPCFDAMVDSDKQFMFKSGTDMTPAHSLVFFNLIVMLEYNPKIMENVRLLQQ